MSLFHGLLAGFATVIFIGPVFFYLLSASLQYGFVGGVTVALGIIASDVAAMWICYNGLATLITKPHNQVWLAIFGGFLVISMGIWNIAVKKNNPQGIKKVTSRHYSALFSKGFLINFINPFVFAVWIALIAYAQSSFGDPLEVKTYLTGVFIGILSTDITKAWFSKYLQKWLTEHRLKNLYRIIGMLLIAFGLRLFYHGWSILNSIN